MSKEGLAFMHDVNAAYSVVIGNIFLIKKKIDDSDSEILNRINVIEKYIKVLRNLADDYYELTDKNEKS